LATTSLRQTRSKGTLLKWTADATDKNGKPIHILWVGKFDGKAYPVKGSPTYNAAGFRVINDHTTFVQGLKDGKVVGNDHDLERSQNTHRAPTLDQDEWEEVHRQEGLRQGLRETTR
jgi:hypothetical protein